MDGGKDAYGVSSIDIAGYVITAIHVVHVSAQHTYTSGKAVGNLIGVG